LSFRRGTLPQQLTAATLVHRAQLHAMLTGYCRASYDCCCCGYLVAASSVTATAAGFTL
jgi:hypothetical protein